MTPITFPDTSGAFPDAAGAFTVPLSRAAEVLALRPVDLLDLVRAGCVFALVVPKELTAERPSLFFAPGLLTDARARLQSREDKLGSAEIVIVAQALRAYLAECTPVGGFEQAISEKRPVLARNNSGHVLAHVQHAVLVDWVQRRTPLAGPGAFAAMPSHITRSLERLGCLSVRGIRALADTKLRWRTWWRIPRSMWSPTGEWDLDFADWPAFADTAGQLDPDETGRPLRLVGQPSADAPNTTPDDWSDPTGEQR